MVDPKQIDTFINLSLDQKKEKILVILEALKDSNSYFQSIYYGVLSLKKIDDETLVSIYQNIFAIGDAISKNQVQKAQDILSKLQSQIAHIREMEAADKKKEWDPEDILKNI